MPPPAAPLSPPEQKTEKHWEDTLTPAERKFLEVQRKREKDTISKAAAEPHKKKIEKLNQYLDSLPVHFDIPKVLLQCTSVIFSSLRTGFMFRLLICI